MEKDLLDFTRVPFDSLYFDPNNPRLAPSAPPGYEDADTLFDPKVQEDLYKQIPEVYKPDDLKAAVESQGWVPIDAIVVWEHPKRKGHYVVLEGNTRKYVLMTLRQDLDRAHTKLQRLKSAKSGVTKHDIEQQQRLVDRLEHIKADTAKVTVAPLNAKTIEELLHRLPRVLGVRHIQPAKEWSPYAKNLYISSLYEQEFAKRFPGADLALIPDLVDDVAALVSQKALETKRNIQAAQAFTHFKIAYEDQLPKGKGEGFAVGDQYFFDLILRNSYAREQFQFGPTDLRLSDEMEGVLFKWAFSKARGGEENLNVFEIAEDIRMWHQMSAYDDKKGTHFSKRLDVSDPDQAPRIREIEIEYFEHKQRTSGVNLFTKLLAEMSELKADALREQASHFRPLLVQVASKAETFIKMIDAVESAK